MALSPLSSFALNGCSGIGLAAIAFDTGRVVLVADVFALADDLADVDVGLVAFPFDAIELDAGLVEPDFAV